MAPGAQDFKLPVSRETIGRKALKAMFSPTAVDDRDDGRGKDRAFARKNSGFRGEARAPVVTMAGLAG